VIRQIRMDGTWVGYGCIMGEILVQYGLYGWSMGASELWMENG
jgi:hypothetical protein